MIEFEAEGDYWLMEKTDEYDCIEESVIINGIEINEDYINDLCERVDYYGMESLTEEEQCIFEKVYGTMVIDTINKYPAR